MENLKFRDLTNDEVEVKKARGNMLLLYKTARVDANILDETVGIAGWQKLYEVLDGKVYCKIGIKIENEWIWKEDCGEETAVEASKGEASDAMKRAGFAWGIGRKLYKSPRIADPRPEDKNAKYYVREIEFTEAGVGTLVIVDSKGSVIFTTKKVAAQAAAPVDNKSDVDKAIEKVNACTTVEQVTKLWTDNKALQSNPKFVAAVKTIGTKLKQATA